MRVIDEERLLKAKKANDADAERRLNRLYELFKHEARAPSLAALKRRLQRRPDPLKLGFQLYTVSRWLVAEIEERLHTSMGWDAGPPTNRPPRFSA